MVEGLRNMGLDCFEPKGAFYVFPSIKNTGLSSLEFAEQLLRAEKVALVPGDAFGACGEGYMRCSYASSTKKPHGGAGPHRPVCEALAEIGLFAVFTALHIMKISPYHQQRHHAEANQPRHVFMKGYHIMAGQHFDRHRKHFADTGGQDEIPKGYRAHRSGGSQRSRRHKRQCPAARIKPKPLRLLKSATFSS